MRIASRIADNLAPFDDEGRVFNPPCNQGQIAVTALCNLLHLDVTVEPTRKLESVLRCVAKHYIFTLNSVRRRVFNARTAVVVVGYRIDDGRKLCIHRHALAA